MKLFAKTKRLGYQETDIVDNQNDVLPIQGGNENSRLKSNTIETPKPLGAIAGQCRPHSTTLSQSLSLEKARASNHMNTAQVLRDEPLSANTHLNTQRAAPSAKEDGYSIQSI